MLQRTGTRLAALAATLAVVAGGCGSPRPAHPTADASTPQQPSSDGPRCPSRPSPAAPPVRLVTDPGTAVIRMWQRPDIGSPPDMPPDIVVYGNGLLLDFGSYHGRRMYGGNAAQADIADAAARIWQLRDIDFGATNLAADPALILEVVTLDGTARLTIEDYNEQHDDAAPAAARCARSAARGLEFFMYNTVAGDDLQPWSPDAVWASISAAPSPSRVSDTDLRWPLHQGLASIGTVRPGGTGARCAVLRGADLAAVLAEVGHQLRLNDNERRWTSDGALWDVALYPLLPGEQRCG